MVTDVRKVYTSSRGRYVALANVSIEIKEGEFVCLLGPSGCGKSTLLNIIAGFEPATSGRVVSDGDVVSSAGAERVMAFQDAGAALFPWLTVEENMKFALRVRSVPRADRADIVERYLKMVDLDRHREKFPSELSGGMRQRLQIARALAVEPRVLLMDEPFGALDAMTRRRMHGFLLEIWQRTGKTIVFVTHDIAEAIVLADRVAMMSVGPGSAITQVIDIDMPRPRGITDPRFAELFNRIENLLAPDIAKATSVH